MILRMFLHTCWSFMYVLFWEMSIQIHCLFLNQAIFILVIEFLKYIFDINFLSELWFVSIFSHSVECLFTLLIVFLAVQKLVVWLNHICVVLLVLPIYALGIISKKSLYPMFSFFLFFFLCVCVCSSGILTHLHLEPLHQPFILRRVFWDRVLGTVCQGWLWTTILLISASWVGRMTGLSH
jgi:hypothetical protein